MFNVLNVTFVIPNPKEPSDVLGMHAAVIGVAPDTLTIM